MAKIIAFSSNFNYLSIQCCYKKQMKHMSNKYNTITYNNESHPVKEKDTQAHLKIQMKI